MKSSTLFLNGMILLGASAALATPLEISKVEGSSGTAKLSFQTQQEQSTACPLGLEEVAMTRAKAGKPGTLDIEAEPNRETVCTTVVGKSKGGLTMQLYRGDYAVKLNGQKVGTLHVGNGDTRITK